MVSPPLTERSPRIEDVEALVGLLAALEGEVWRVDDAADTVPEWATKFAERLSRKGLLPDGAGNEALRRTLGDLNQRLRYVLGEHDEPDRTS
jgi:hypothetical protein